MAELQAHHAAWLSAHPDRSEAWLRERLADGFDVHHLDGEHSNNEPDNLVLIESRDHARLHGNDRFTRIALGHRPDRVKARRERAALLAYQMLARGAAADEIERGTGYRYPGAVDLARALARQNGWYWPERIDRAPTPWPAASTTAGSATTPSPA